MAKDASTENKIIDAARRVFLAKGMSGARMQEIADEAGINKALLHYYFRSKDKLFERIFNEVINRIAEGLRDIFEKDMDLFERLDHIVEVYIDTIIANQYIPLFVINEINNNPGRFSDLLQEHVLQHFIELFDQIQSAANEGIIRSVHPIHLLMNVLGMIVFPFAINPLLSHMADKAHLPFVEGFLEERRDEVKKFIRAALKPN
jgi:AcrR family transcriptional regulator